MNSIFKKLYLITLLLIFAYANIYSADNSIIKKEESITTIEKALGKANEYLGINALLDSSIKSNTKTQLFTLKEDKTPFLGNSLEGKRVWHIIYPSVSLYQAKSDEWANCKREIHVYIDSLTGILIKVFSPYKGNDEMKIPNKELDISIEGMTLNEEYTGYVEGEPFMQLYCLFEGRDPIDIECNEFSAILVNYRRGNNPVQPVWIISSWGREYIEIPDTSTNIDLQTRSYYLRRICLAETCQIGSVMKITGL